jgi:Fe-S cluster assembly protein SufB
MRGLLSSAQWSEDMPAVQETIEQVKAIDVDQYKYGFVTDIESERGAKGLSEETVRFLSAKKNEPEWMTEWRLDALRRFQTMDEPNWARVHYPKIDFDDLYYWAAPKSVEGPKSLDEVDPELLETYEKLGIPLREQEILAGVEPENRVAVDAVFDSVSVVTTFKEELKKAGVIFCSISEALREYPDLVKKYLGSVVPVTDNYYATLNSAVFSDGSFVYVPEGVRCPMELSTYFRINEQNTGQFERTLIIADKGAYVSYLEGCTAPQRDENQLHAAVVELVALDDAEIKYSTVQNWFPGDAQGKGGIYNFVTKRGDCRGQEFQDLLDPGRDRLGDHLEIPVLRPARRQFPRRVLLDRRLQRLPADRQRHQDDPPRQEHVQPDHFQGHFGRQVAEHLPRSGVCPPQGLQCAQLHPVRQLLIGQDCGAHTVPYIEARTTATFEHEATTSKISDDQMFYCLAARHVRRRGGGADRQRLRQGRHPAAADGIRGRGPEADLDQPGGIGRLKIPSESERFKI